MRSVQPLVPHVRLPILLAGPRPSGSAGLSRRCQGRFRPHPRPGDQAALSFTTLLRQRGGAGLSPPLGSTAPRGARRRRPKADSARSSNCRDRLVARADQLDSLLTELGWVLARTGHDGRLPVGYAQVEGVHQPGQLQRRPPPQQRTAHRGPEPDPVPASHPRLHRPPHDRRQDQPRENAALPATSPATSTGYSKVSRRGLTKHRSVEPTRPKSAHNRRCAGGSRRDPFACAIAECDCPRWTAVMDDVSLLIPS